MGELCVRALANPHCRHVSRELSGAAGNAGAAGGNPTERPRADDRQDNFCDLGGRIALHAERRPADAEGNRAGYGRDRWPPSGADRENINLPGLAGSYRALLPKKAMNEIQKLASDDSSKHDPVFRQRQSFVLPDRQAVASEP